MKVAAILFPMISFIVDFPHELNGIAANETRMTDTQGPDPALRSKYLQYTYAHNENEDEDEDEDDDDDTICVRSGRQKREKLKLKYLPNPDHERLYKFLEENLKSEIMPRPSRNAPLKINLKFTLITIVNVEETKNTITWKFWLAQTWVDKTLTWNPNDYGNLESVVFPQSKFWVPKFTFINAGTAEKKIQVFRGRVRSNGDRKLSFTVLVKTFCSFDVRYFPFDDQKCRLELSSWMYTLDELVIGNISIYLMEYVLHKEWHLIDVSMHRDNLTVGPFQHYKVYALIHVARKSIYYTYTVILPCTMLTMLTLLGFWIPCDSGEKVTLGLSIILSYSAFMEIVAENMPPTANIIPLLGVYVTISMFLTCLSVVLCTVISVIYHLSDLDLDVPPCLLSMAHSMDVVFGIMKARQDKIVLEDQDDNDKNPCFQLVIGKTDFKTFIANSREKFRTFGETFRSKLKPNKEVSDPNENKNSNIYKTIGNRSSNANTKASIKKWQKTAYIRKRFIKNFKSMPNPKPGGSTDNKNNNSIYKTQSNKSNNSKSKSNKDQWQETAYILDRGFFWVYLTMCMVVGIYYMVAIPIQRSIINDAIEKASKIYSRSLEF